MDSRIEQKTKTSGSVAENKGLMTQFPFARGREFVCKNIGDYIQSVASLQFAGVDAEYIEQEEADTYRSSNGRKTRLIMNGWFQWRAENWPPSDDIDPLLISMHISPLKAAELLSEKGINFLKSNGPVGCRDKYTLDLLQKHGVNSYFSGCLTLTLGKTYALPQEERRGYYFVDPYFKLPPISKREGASMFERAINLLKVLPYYIRHKKIIDVLAGKPFFAEYSPTGFLDRDRSFCRSLYKATIFHKAYSKRFSDRLLVNATYVTHWIDVPMSGEVTNSDLIACAESLIKKYASAEMIITSRIHAGLPALGCETPVIFIADEEVISNRGSFNTPGRLEGLIELFRLIDFSDGNLRPIDSVLQKDELIDEGFTFDNKDDWKKLAQDLEAKASAFMA